MEPVVNMYDAWGSMSCLNTLFIKLHYGVILARSLLVPTFDVYFIIEHCLLRNHHTFGGMMPQNLFSPFWWFHYHNFMHSYSLEVMSQISPSTSTYVEAFHGTRVWIWISSLYFGTHWLHITISYGVRSLFVRLFKERNFLWPLSFLS